MPAIKDTEFRNRDAMEAKSAIDDICRCARFTLDSDAKYPPHLQQKHSTKRLNRIVVGDPMSAAELNEMYRGIEVFNSGGNGAIFKHAKSASTKTVTKFVTSSGVMSEVRGNLLVLALVLKGHTGNVAMARTAFLTFAKLSTTRPYKFVDPPRGEKSVLHGVIDMEEVYSTFSHLNELKQPMTKSLAFEHAWFTYICRKYVGLPVCDGHAGNLGYNIEVPYARVYNVAGRIFIIQAGEPMFKHLDITFGDTDFRTYLVEDPASVYSGVVTFKAFELLTISYPGSAEQLGRTQQGEPFHRFEEGVEDFAHLLGDFEHMLDDEEFAGMLTRLIKPSREADVAKLGLHRRYYA